MKEIINFNIGGTKFSTTLATLKKIPNTTLYDFAIKIEERVQRSEQKGIAEYGAVSKLEIETQQPNVTDMQLSDMKEVSSNKAQVDQPQNKLKYIKTEQNEYFFDRDPEVFRCLLNLYRTGHLHIPNSLCTPMVRVELKFWRIDELVLAPCCLSSYKQFDDAKEIIKEIENFFQEDVHEKHISGKCGHSTQKIRIAIWRFMTEPSSSIPAKVWLVIQWFIIIGSFIIVAMETIPAGRSPRLQFYNQTVYDYGVTNKAFRIAWTNLDPVLYFTDVALMFFMLIELIIKFLCAPRQLKFLRSASTICDILSVLPHFVTFITIFTKPSVLANNDVLLLFRIFWMFRLFRIGRFMVVMRQVLGFRIMCLTLKSSYKELALLLLCISFGMMIFATLMFYAELEHSGTFDNIFIGLWWSVVTMTTVGYGDMAPGSLFGYLVGGVCTLSGIITTGLAIPIISNKFTTYYEFANMYMAWKEQQRVNRNKNGEKIEKKARCKYSEVLDKLET